MFLTWAMLVLGRNYSKLDSLELQETQLAICPVKIPYIPTLLSFREIQRAKATIRKLKIQHDIFLVDAQGLTHPRRCGFASHFGLILGKPTIGGAKSRLIGIAEKRDGETLLLDKGEVIGAVVMAMPGSNPVYVSIAHLVSLKTSIEIVLHCSKSRVPEPLLQAHKLATKERIRLVRKKPK